MILTDASGQKWVSLDAYNSIKLENDILKHNLKETVGILDGLKKAIEIALRKVDTINVNDTKQSD
jgi:hypothetical protein